MSETKPTNPKDRIGCRKAGVSCVPASVIAELGVAMTEGALKYGAYNYREAGVRMSVYYDALMRHMMAFWEGEDIDPDSGVSHVTKAIATLVVLRDAMLQGMCTDDRPPKAKPFYADLNAKSGELIGKYGKPKEGEAEDYSWAKGEPIWGTKPTGDSPVNYPKPHPLPTYGGRIRSGVWYEWPGGACPIPSGASTTVRHRGVEGVFKVLEPERHAGWQHTGVDNDIVAFRLDELP